MISRRGTPVTLALFLTLALFQFGCQHGSAMQGSAGEPMKRMGHGSMQNAMPSSAGDMKGEGMQRSDESVKAGSMHDTMQGSAEPMEDEGMQGAAPMSGDSMNHGAMEKPTEPSKPDTMQ